MFKLPKQIAKIQWGIVLLFTLLSVNTSAQFVDLGQDPASVRWKQINTDNFQIIYPDFFEENAQYIANMYARLYAHANSLGVKAKKMSMIIRANGAVSNGNAGWAPRKSELYTTPPQDPSDSWLTHLCVHEFRHIVQYDKVNQGFSKVLYYLFGEQYTMALIGVYIPMWLLEGDATVFETAVGHSGRGHSPEFLNEVKAQVMEKGIYYYYKAVLGSYKDYIPGRYNLGYYMVGNSRIHYGDEIWQDVFTRVGRKPWSIMPVTQSLRRTLEAKRDSIWNTPYYRSLFVNPEAVKSANRNNDPMRTLYRDNFCELQQVWQKEIRSVHHDFDTIPTSGKLYANYHYPIAADNDAVIAYKEGLGEEGALVMLYKGHEKVLFRPGILYDYKLGYQQLVVCWSEYKPHPRWEHAGRLVLATYNLQSGKYERHPVSANRFSPFPANGNWGFVEVDSRNRASLVITDARFSQEIFRLQGAAGELFIHPSFTSQGEILTVVQSTEGKWLEKIDISTGTRHPITAATHYEIDNPVALGGQVFYRAAFNSNNALYVQEDSDSGQHLLEAQYGIRYPSLSPDRKRLFFSFYTADGYKPAQVALEQTRPRPLEQKPFRLAKQLKKMEQWDAPLTGSDSLFSSKKYTKAAHLFNIHSWGPIFPDRDDMDIEFGIALSSQNKLSTFYWTGGYVWSSDYDHGNWRLKFTYKGLWPVLQVEYRNGRYDFMRSDAAAIRLADGAQDTVLYENRSRLSRLEGTLQFPFSSYRKNYYRSIIPFIRYELQAIHHLKVQHFYAIKDAQQGIWQAADKKEYQFSNPTTLLQLMQYGIRLNHQTRRNTRDINPRWGQWLELGYQHTPFRKLDWGHTWWGEGGFYFPGIAAHHSLYTYLGHQKKSNAGRYYSRQIFSPRGITLHGTELTTFRSTYTFPVAYPDRHLRSLLYVKRIVASLFFDAGREKERYTINGNAGFNIVVSSNPMNYQSFGIEATADSHFFTLTFPVNWGFRLGYETKTKTGNKSDALFLQFLFSVGLSI